jgi:hypothetical protein
VDSILDVMKILFAILLSLISVQAATTPSSVQIAPTYDNVADMIAYHNPHGNYRSAYVRGYYEPGDGGGGAFVVTNTVASTNWGTRFKSAFGSTRSMQRSTPPPYTSKEFGAKADDSTDDYEKIFGTYGLFSAQTEGIISSGVHRVGTSATLSDGRAMRFESKGIIRMAAATVLTINGDVSADHKKHFDLTDTVSPVLFGYQSSVENIPVTWFGADGNIDTTKTNVNRIAIQSAITAQGSKRQWVFLPSGTYLVGGGQITVPSGRRIRGVNRDSSVISFYANTDGDALFYIDNSAGNGDTYAFEDFGANNGIRNTGAGDITDIDTATDVLTLVHATTLTTGSAINFWTKTTAPTGLTAGNTYYVRVITSGQLPTVSLHPTATDANNNTAKINITAYGTGPHSLIPGTTVPFVRRCSFLKDYRADNTPTSGDVPELTLRRLQLQYFNKDAVRLSGVPYLKCFENRFLSIANSIEWAGDNTGPSACLKFTYYLNAAQINGNRFGSYCDKVLDIPYGYSVGIIGNSFETIGRTTATSPGSSLYFGNVAGLSILNNYVEACGNSGTDAVYEFVDSEGAVLQGGIHLGDYGGTTFTKNFVKLGGTSDMTISGGSYIGLTNAGNFVVNNSTRKSFIARTYFSATATPTELTTYAALIPYLTGEEYIDIQFKDVDVAHGTRIARQLGGTVGTDQIEMSHDGTDGTILSRQGKVIITPESTLGIDLNTRSLVMDNDWDGLTLLRISNDNASSSATAGLYFRTSDASGYLRAFPSVSGSSAKVDRLVLETGSDATALLVSAASSGQTVEVAAGSTTVVMTVKQLYALLAKPLTIAEQSSDIAAADVTSGANAKDRVAYYMKNDKLVFAYNAAGTVTYLSIPLDGSSTTWTHSSVAP